MATPDLQRAEPALAHLHDDWREAQSEWLAARRCVDRLRTNAEADPRHREQAYVRLRFASHRRLRLARDLARAAIDPAAAPLATLRVSTR